MTSGGADGWRRFRTSIEKNEQKQLVRNHNQLKCQKKGKVKPEPSEPPPPPLTNEQRIDKHIKKLNHRRNVHEQKINGTGYPNKTNFRMKPEVVDRLYKYGEPERFRSKETLKDCRNISKLEYMNHTIYHEAMQRISIMAMLSVVKGQQIINDNKKNKPKRPHMEI